MAGDLDTTFDGDGKVTTAVGSFTDEARGVAIQSDGKIVVAGISFNGSNNDFALTRYNSDGSLDTTFDDDGKVTTAVGSSYDEAYSVAIQSDGKILVAGSSDNGRTYEFVLTRYNSDGSLDTTFDGDGKVTTDVGSIDDRGFSVAIQSDGKIVVAGSSFDGSDWDFALTRYNSDGSLDTTFDGDGKVTTDVGSSHDYAYSVAIQSDGMIVVAGYSDNGSNNDFALTRYDSNGSLDSTFDGDGKVTTAVGSSNDYAFSVAIQSDGKIVVAGFSNVGSSNEFALTRYSSNGSLDTTFDGDGKVTTVVGSSADLATSVAIQSDAKIVVAGASYNDNGRNWDFALTRYNSNGSLDTTFDGDGKVTTDVGSSNDEPYSVAIQSDGKIVVAGYSHNGSDWDFALTRYNVNEAPTDIALSSTSIPENAGANAVVGTLTTTDVNAGNTFTYSLVAGTGDTDNFAFNVSGSTLLATNSFDYESKSTYSVRIRSMDQGSLWTEKTFLLIVTDVVDGDLDNTFDGDGKVTTDVGSFRDEAYSVAIQSDGKIVVAGYSLNGSVYDFALTRYNSDGSLDTTFDGDGKVTTAVGSSHDEAHGVAIQSDGKIVVAGFSDNGSNNDFALTRYNSDGSLDTTFDGDGKVTTDVGSSHDYAYSVAIQSDGKIVVAGYSVNGGSSNFALTRYNSNGSLDTTFDGDGKVTTAVGSSADYAFSVAIQSDGKIVVAGYSLNGSNYEFALTRYNSNGNLDTTFDGDGKVTTAVGSSDDFARGVAIQSDGKIVVAGSSVNGGSNNFALTRYNSNGSLDTTFDGDGKVTTAVGSSYDVAYSVAIQSDGKIVVAGASYNGNGSDWDFALTRYNVNLAPTDIALSSTSIPENAGANAVVGTLTTTDVNAGNTFTYTLVSGAGSIDNAAFNISSNSLQATSSFDFETKSSYTIRIRSTDQGGFFTEKTFTVTVIDINESPTNISLSSITIAENLAANTPVGTLNTADPDTGNSFTYALVTGSGDTDNVSFNISANSLRATSSFDFETKSSYTVRIRSTDQNGLFVENAFAIQVVNANESPTEIGLSWNMLAENAGFDETVGTFSTTDVDAGNTFTYSLVTGAGDANNASFRVLGSAVVAISNFDFETKSNYSIRVRSTDQGGLFVEKMFVITVIDVNEAPTDISLSSSAIAENAAANTPIGTLSTADPDAGNSVTYTLVAGSGDADNAVFNIAGSILRATNSLDFETKSSYTVRVRSTDQGGLFVDKAFTIQVLDVNESPTDINLTSTAIPENAGSNATVGTFSTADVDAGNTFVYSLVAGSGDTDNGAFNISGSTLRATGSFDFETRTDYTVRVRSTDQGGLFVEKVFAIRVVNANEAPVAVGDSYWVSVDSFKILDVLANDSDIDSAIDPTSIVIVGQPSHGTATPLPDGTVRYTPNTGYRGAESFTYRVRDSLGLLSNSATVQLRVNSAPNTTPDSLVVKQTITTVLDVLRNDSDPDGSLDPATLVIDSGSDVADVVVQADGTIRFTPQAGFLGTTRFRYVVSDNEGRPSVPTDVTVLVVVSIYQNPGNRFDVDDDETVSPLDVLVLINLLNSQAPSLPVDGLPSPPAYVDVNADNRVDPLDVLELINHMNSRSNGEGEGDADREFDDVFASDDWQKELRKSNRRSLKRF
jgi:uncharacterized delta-60 repeat protein